MPKVATLVRGTDSRVLSSPLFATDTVSEQASGPFGLARVKNYDRRLAFYPGFAVERSLALEFRSERITELSMKVQRLRKELDSVDASKPPSQHLKGSAEELNMLMTRLADSVAEYGMISNPTTESLCRG